MNKELQLETKIAVKITGKELKRKNPYFIGLLIKLEKPTFYVFDKHLTNIVFSLISR